MTTNETTLKGKWLEIKGEIQKTWGKLTEDEIEQTKGDVKSIAGLLLQKYGEQSEKYKEQLSALVDKYSDKKENIVEQIKKDLKS